MDLALPPIAPIIWKGSNCIRQVQDARKNRRTHFCDYSVHVICYGFFWPDHAFSCPNVIYIFKDNVFDGTCKLIVYRTSTKLVLFVRVILWSKRRTRARFSALTYSFCSLNCLLFLSRRKVIQQAVAAGGGARGYRVSSNEALDAATDACLAQLAHAVFKDKLVLAGVKLRWERFRF